MGVGGGGERVGAGGLGVQVSGFCYEAFGLATPCLRSCVVQGSRGV